MTTNTADVLVAAQVRLTHHPVTNPMYPRPICDYDGEEWPCLTELQVQEGLRRAALTAKPSPSEGEGS